MTSMRDFISIANRITMKKLFDEYDFPFFEYGNIDLSNVENVKNNINQRFYMLERSLLACSLQEQKIDDVIGELNDLASFVLYLPYANLTVTQSYYFRCVLDGCRHWLYVLNMNPSERENMYQTYLKSFGVRS